jgi:methionine synthase I (cobalamin-dependent)/5,10-methylenetetrahydrofolate reductase
LSFDDFWFTITSSLEKIMDKSDFKKRLENNVLLFDGAIGTIIYSHGVYFNRCYDELNLSNPNLIKKIHTAYIEAGADVIETNTFGANRFKLAPHGLSEKLAAINYEGARLAREVAGTDIIVAGSVGPLGIRIEPWGPTSIEETRQAFKEQVRALKDGGVDLFMLETFSDLREIQQAILAIQKICDYPIIASMTISNDGNSLYGTTPETFTQRLDEWGADAIGLNCSMGPHTMLQVVEQMVKVTPKPIMVMPNAGSPRMVDGRNFYLASDEYMAEYARHFIHAGAKIVGGCCGTTPEYIKAMNKAISSIIPQHRPRIIQLNKESKDEVPTIPMEEKSILAKKIANNEFVTTVEITPPRGCNPSKIIESSKFLKENNVDAVNIPDGPRALTRMSAQHLSTLIAHEVGIETILHYTCRDRNLLGMMSDMLGLYPVGVKNLLIITGDPPKMGDFPDATAVFDVDSIGLTNMVSNLNKGIDLGGNRMGKPTGYFIGVGLNPGSPELDNEIRRFEWKVKAGAEFAITQPVFDLKQLLDFLNKIQHVRIPIIAGIWPLVSLRNAEFMNNEVPGVTVPKEIMDRMRKTKTRDESLKEGLQIAKEMVLQVKEHVQGIQVSAPFGKVKHALEVISILHS